MAADIAKDGASVGVEQPVNGATVEGLQDAAAKANKVADVDAARLRVLSAFGQVTLAMMNVPRYRHHTLADLEALVLEPLMRDRIAIAFAKGEGKSEALAGIAIWASVSDAVDAKIREQIKAGTFPVRLKPAEWQSGECVWLLDIVAPDRKLSTALLANFKNVTGQAGLHVHPIVAQLIDKEALQTAGIKINS